MGEKADWCINHCKMWSDCRYDGVKLTCDARELALDGSIITQHRTDRIISLEEFNKIVEQ